MIEPEQPNGVLTRVTIIFLAILALLILAAALSRAEGLPMNWEPQPNGLLLAIWDDNGDGQPDRQSLHTIFRQYWAALPLDTLRTMRIGPGILIAFYRTAGGLYIYEIASVPLMQKSPHEALYHRVEVDEQF